MDLARAIAGVVIVEVGPSIDGGSYTQTLKRCVAEATGPGTVLAIVKDTSAIRGGTACKLYPSVEPPTAKIDLDAAQSESGDRRRVVVAVADRQVNQGIHRVVIAQRERAKGGGKLTSPNGELQANVRLCKVGAGDDRCHHSRGKPLDAAGRWPRFLGG